jgi:hypothetical protein
MTVCLGDILGCSRCARIPEWAAGRSGSSHVGRSRMRQRACPPPTYRVIRRHVAQMQHDCPQTSRHTDVCLLLILGRVCHDRPYILSRGPDTCCAGSRDRDRGGATGARRASGHPCTHPAREVPLPPRASSHRGRDSRQEARARGRVAVPARHREHDQSVSAASGAQAPRGSRARTCLHRRCGRRLPLLPLPHWWRGACPSRHPYSPL